MAKEQGFLKKQLYSNSSNMNDIEKNQKQKQYFKIQKTLKDRTAEYAKQKNLDLMTKEGKDELFDIASKILEQMEMSYSLPGNVKVDLISNVVDEIQGLGPLEPLLKDDSITEIMVNGKKNNKADVFIERKGIVQKAEDVSFRDHQQIIDIIQRIIHPLNRRIDNDSPMVDARLKDGSRVNAVIPPISIDGPCITIRKFSKEKLTIEDLIKFNSINKNMATFLQACTLGKKNILISGGTGTGKTTVLNVLSNFIPLSERILTIEDSAELQLAHQEIGNLIRLESRPKNTEGKGQITIQDCLVNTLRQRPDRIIVGECRNVEAYDMIQAMNTGHEGSLSTLHANGPEEALMRLEGMILTAKPNMPLEVVRKTIAMAVNIIVQLKRFNSDGSRKTVAISEIVGYDSKKNEYKIRDIFIYNQTGYSNDGRVLGFYEATGNKPTFFEDFERRRINMPNELFINKK